VSRTGLVLATWLVACGGGEVEPRTTAASPSGGAENEAGDGAEVSGGAPTEAAPVDPTLICTGVADCVLLTDTCGWPAAASAAHAAEVEARYRALGCCVSCAAPPPGTAHVECVAGACTAVRDAQPPGS
jgi:hypothetical protein